MWERLLARLLEKYQWFVNPLAGRRDPLTLLMQNHGFIRAPFRLKKFYNVFYDGARLVGIYYIDFPSELFSTQLRACVYKKRDFSGEGFGREKFCLVYMFSHSAAGEPYKLGSHVKSDFLEFRELVSYLKSAKNLSEVRTEIFRIQQNSKKNPVPRMEKT